jgi:hypothetical protein
MKKCRLITSLILVLLLTNCKSAAVKSIQYSDQNNNRYSITSSSFKYDPITPNESSSGVYSGGDPVQVVLSREDYNNILNLAERIMETSEGKDVKREMLTSVLVISEEGKTRQAILKRSDERSELEDLLQELKQ